MSVIKVPIDVLINEEEKKKEDERERLRLPLNKWQPERLKEEEQEESNRGEEIIKVY